MYFFQKIRLQVQFRYYNTDVYCIWLQPNIGEIAVCFNLFLVNVLILWPLKTLPKMG